MSTVIFGGGGPRPQARVVAVVETGNLAGSVGDISSYEVRDGNEVLLSAKKQSYCLALLPFIQSGD
jgi:hypothetical protein